MGSIEPWICTLLTGRCQDRASHAATEIKLGEVICLLCRESEEKNRGSRERPDCAGRLQRGRSSCRPTSVIFLHFILVLPSPLPNAKVGLRKTAKSEGYFLRSVVQATSIDSHVPDSGTCSSNRWFPEIASTQNEVLDKDAENIPVSQTAGDLVPGRNI